MTGEATWLTGAILLFGAFAILLLATAGRRIGLTLRAAYRDIVCPASHEVVHCVVLSHVVDNHPVDIASCSAFDDPERVACHKACLRGVTARP